MSQHTLGKSLIRFTSPKTNISPEKFWLTRLSFPFPQGRSHQLSWLMGLTTQPISDPSQLMTEGTWVVSNSFWGKFIPQNGGKIMIQFILRSCFSDGLVQAPKLDILQPTKLLGFSKKRLHFFPFHRWKHGFPFLRKWLGVIPWPLRWNQFLNFTFLGPMAASVRCCTWKSWWVSKNGSFGNKQKRDSEVFW